MDLWNILAASESWLERWGTLLCSLGPIVFAWVLYMTLGVKPTSRMVWIAIVWLCVAILGAFYPAVESIWPWFLGVWASLACLDLFVLLWAKRPEVERRLPGRMAVGVEENVELLIRNHRPLVYQVELFDGIPEESKCEDFPRKIKLPAKGFHKITYGVTVPERGEAVFGKSFLELRTGLELWSRQHIVGEEQSVRVYPNYEPVIQLALLAMESQPQPMGIIQKNRAGLSKDFHQLRDYQYGDNLSQIDWKASSKRLSLISRDYHELRDQTVILAIDCGKRMRAMDGETAQFDHCLNAVLLLAYVALRQGDSVGVMSFGQEERWLPPVKGTQSMTTILNHLYDYQATTSPSDYSEAVEQLMRRQARRALVIMLTNVRGEDGLELVRPLRMMRKRHVVLLSSLREKAIMERLDTTAETMKDALGVARAQQYLHDRRAVLEELQSYGISTLETTARELPVALANRYLVDRESL